MILDAFTGGEWRQLFEEYQEGRMTVGQFNSKVFSMVKADRQTLLDIVMAGSRVRPGFTEMVEYCREKGFRFVIVSNGLDFYISEILKDVGISNIEVHAAETDFLPEGLRVRHKGPGGNYLDADV